MPTAITHSLVGAAAASVFANKKIPARFWVLSIICPLIPDLDVIGYQFFYIPLFHVFGHRGFFHSLFFALLSSLVLVGIFFRKEQFLLKPWWFFVLYFFCSCQATACSMHLRTAVQASPFFLLFRTNDSSSPGRPSKFHP